MAASPQITLARARAHWHARTGLATPLSGDPDEVIARTGWVRTLGGADVYLAVRARVPGLSRRALDGLVEQSRLRVIPAVRGCIYLVPAAHVPLALRVAEEAWRPRAEKEVVKAGATWKEVEEVARAVASVLTKGPANTDGIRKGLPPGAVRSLGEKGKKIGMSSVMPTALRDLEFRGLVERTLEGGKLDTERYVWRSASADEGWSAVHVPDDAVGRWAELARIFLGYAGPARIEDFAGWTALPLRDARAGFEKAGVARIAVEGFSDEAYVLPEDVAELARPAEPSQRVALLSFEDNFLIAHGGPRWVVDAGHWWTPIRVWGGKGLEPGTLGKAAHIQTRTLTVGDQLAGIWEMDPDAGDVLWAPFATVPRDAREQIERLASETAAFLRDEIGHAHSFSLDTDAEVRDRAAEVARMASGGKIDKPKKAKPAKKAAPAKKKPAPKARPTKKAAPAKKPVKQVKKVAKKVVKKVVKKKKR
jgi:hypothetical protein